MKKWTTLALGAVLGFGLLLLPACHDSAKTAEPAALTGQTTQDDANMRPESERAVRGHRSEQLNGN